MSTLFKTIFRLFLTGIASLLPFVVTIFIVTWGVKLADAYVGPSSAFGHLLANLVGPEYKLYGYLVGYLIVILLIMFLGFLATRATVARIHKTIDSMFSSIPLIGKIYSAVGQVVDLFGKNGHGGLERFGGVAHIRTGNVRVLCLLTSSERYNLEDGREHFLVFIPNSPIPATGFNLLVPVEDVERLDMPIEDLAKLLMSLGLLGPQVLRTTHRMNNGAEDGTALLSK
jgi:uncharacterized membrane protein